MLVASNNGQEKFSLLRFFLSLEHAIKAVSSVEAEGKQCLSGVICEARGCC
jgi:hypothetical protein